MKNTAKLIVFSVFALSALFIFLSGNNFYKIDAAGFSGAVAQATPPINKNTNSSGGNSNTKPMAVNTAANTNAIKATPPITATPATALANTATTSTVPTAGGKSIPKSFTLGKESQSEYGEVTFDHDSHAFKNYSPDGKSPITCVECHHTDQPKAALKAPDVTSERDETLTLAVFQKTSQKVSECRACHFQDGNVPDGKTMPAAGGKDLNNQLAFHINCNTCHDAAFAARRELKTHKGFATSKDCAVCHKTS